MSVPRTVSLHRAHPRLKLDRPGITRVIHRLDTQFGATPADIPHLPTATRRRARAGLPLVPDGELSLAFITDDALARLHDQFLDDPSPTDVITFEGTADGTAAGEICVSVDTAARYADSHAGDFARELTLYVIHGWLHLAGYDDLQPAKKRRMRAAERRALALVADTLPTWTLSSARPRRPVR